MKIIHIKDSTGSKDEVYIGRSGKGQDGYFGNPVKIGESCPMCGQIHKNAGSTLKCYEIYLSERLKSDEKFKQKVKDLSGKILVCFCKRKQSDPCHGDILSEYIENLNRNFIIFDK